MCKWHCLDHGGCDCHKDEDLASKAAVRSSSPDFSALVAYADAPSKRWEAAALAQMRAQQARIHTLAQNTPLPPSPTLSEECEYASLMNRSPPVASLSSEPSSSRRPSLTSSVSRNSSPSFLSYSQLSLASSASSSRLSSASHDNATNYRVTLFYWPSNGPVTIQAHQDEAFHTHWPRISLRDIGHLLVTDELPEIEEFYQCFSSDYHSWMKINIDYHLKVTDDDPIFIRRLGVTGTDEDPHLPQLIVPSTPPRPAKTTRTPRAKTRLGKRKDRVTVVDNSSDEEVVVVDYRPAIKQEPITPPPKRRHFSTSCAVQSSSTLNTIPSSTRRESSPYFPLSILSSP
ncbi:hypothetical protein B0H11DRAFT_2214723 [Mycena galericulata]|nr:hypothetical protein B0H11DRAFT_2214723 [Mycena galericulata]